MGVKKNSKTGTAKRVIIYIRVSKLAGEKISPKLQEKECRAFAAKNGWKVVDVIKDENQTGREFSQRKIKDIISKIASGEADILLVMQWDRFGRNLEESLFHLARVLRVGGEAYSATEPGEYETAAGKLSISVLLGIARFQSDQISNGWKRVLEDRWTDGFPHYAAPRWGYRLCDSCPKRPFCKKCQNKGHVFYWCKECPPRKKCEKCASGIQIIDPDKSEVVKETYQRLVDGHVPYSVCKWLNTIGERTAKGAKFDNTKLFSMLDTGFAAGLIRRRSTRGQEGALQAKTDSSWWIENADRPDDGSTGGLMSHVLGQFFSREEREAFKAKIKAAKEHHGNV